MVRKARSGRDVPGRSLPVTAAQARAAKRAANDAAALAFQRRQAAQQRRDAMEQARLQREAHAAAASSSAALAAEVAAKGVADILDFVKITDARVAEAIIAFQSLPR